MGWISKAHQMEATIAALRAELEAARRREEWLARKVAFLLSRDEERISHLTTYYLEEAARAATEGK